MKPRGVNRVTIAVKDLEKGMALYSKLLGATFHDQCVPAEPFGLRCAISWDAGIELVAPLPGRDSFVTSFLEKQGEGLMGVVFAVDDVEECCARAEKMGIGVLSLIADYDENQIDAYLQGRFKKYKEYMLNPADTFGVGPVIGQIEPK
jgi:methylmalonyl-CoA/ethylmalonyl-CoA epimerase